MSLNNSQYDTLIRQYNARQFHNQHLLDERIQEVYGKCPRLTEIDNEISSISVASAKQLLSDDGAEDSSVLSSLKVTACCSSLGETESDCFSGLSG